MPRPTWIRVLLLLPSTLLAAEPAQTLSVPAQIATDGVAQPASLSLASAFDLRGSAVRDVVRNTAARQSDTGYRVESAVPTKPDPAAALRQERPAPGREAKPRLPDRPPPCDGFLSCGIETLLDLNDGDIDEEYGRHERHRLMNQGSFTDKSGCEACQSPPPPTFYKTSGAGTELRPDRP